MLRIKDGFSGQRLVVYPFYVVESALSNPLSADLVVHSMGFFPEAHGHYINRPNGCGEYLLIYCLKGKGGYRLHATDHEVGENQFFILPADMAHAYWANPSNPWTIYWIHFKGQKAPYIYSRLQGVREIPFDADSRMKERTDLFDQLLNVMESETTDERVEFVNMSVQYLFASFVHLSVYREAKHATEKAENTHFVSLATHFMHEHLDRNLSLDDMASYFGYSKSYFYRLFYRQTHYAPVAYFQQMKMKWAASLLQNTNLKVNQVAMKLGYTDPYYFSRLFKKTMGVSPLYYKKSSRQPELTDS